MGKLPSVGYDASCMTQANISRVSQILDDYASVQRELGRILQQDPDLYMLNVVAVERDWDQTRALKAAVVVLAARLHDARQALCEARHLQPIVVPLPVGPVTRPS
jgi:hypothetical protein